MSLPDNLTVRRMIDNIPEERYAMAVRAIYVLGAARTCEIVGKPLRNENAYGPRGTEVELTKYIPSPDDEIGDWQLRRRVINGEKVEPIDVAVFHVRIAKRKPIVGEPVPSRKVALPLNDVYEPWARLLYDYWKKRGNDVVFPFDRCELWRYISEHDVFHGLTVPIKRYFNTKTRQVVPTHTRAFKLHALRKLRFRELRMFYRFSAEERAAFVGWSMATRVHEGERVASMEQTYDSEFYSDWQMYFPKLLRPLL